MSTSIKLLDCDVRVTIIGRGVWVCCADVAKAGGHLQSWGALPPGKAAKSVVRDDAPDWLPCWVACEVWLPSAGASCLAVNLLAALRDQAMDVLTSTRYHVIRQLSDAQLDYLNYEGARGAGIAGAE